MNGSDNQYAGLHQIPPVDVDDALQYTPLSSIVPLTPGMFGMFGMSGNRYGSLFANTHAVIDMIPIPTISTVSGLSFYHSDAEREISRQALDLLNQRLEERPGSKFVGKYVQDISSQLPAAATA